MIPSVRRSSIVNGGIGAPGTVEPDREHHRQQRGHVRGDAREHVVREEEHGDEQDHRERRRESAHVRGDRGREPLHEAHLVQSLRERDQRREPCERVPRLLVRNDVLPGHTPVMIMSEMTTSAAVVAST